MDHIETDRSKWLPPVLSMVTSHGSLTLLDLSRPEGVSFLIDDFRPDNLEDLELIGQTSSWPLPVMKDWKHALSPDMTDLLNEYYLEADLDGNIGLFCEKCDDPIDQVNSPTRAAMSVWLISVWQHWNADNHDDA